MTTTNLNVTGLDFASARNNLVNYLKNNTQFKDINYEGSNISVLLDVLAYNTYLNAFYTNMVASEMFLDTAQLRDSVVSHAKELNYIPRSFVSAKATITVAVTPSTNVQSVVIQKDTSFTSRLGSNTYSFTTESPVVITTANSGVFSATVDVYEGLTTNETFVANFTESARYVITNSKVDTSSISVTVYEDGGQSELTYTSATGLAGVTSSSQVFWLQPTNNSQYELIFGDNVFGRRPKDGSSIVVSYRVSSGQLPNGCSVFVSDGTIDGHTNISVTTVTPAEGGDVSELVESIRFNAPRAFQVQNRAVTASDFEVLLTNRFSEIQAISVFGGDELSPPLYGTVCIAIDVANADGAPQSRKDAYADFLKDKMSLTTRLKFIDPEFTYIIPTVEVYYNPAATKKTSADIETLGRAAVSNYNTLYLQGFKKTFYTSGISRLIVDSDSSITGADVNIILAKRIVPELNNSSWSAIINFDNQLQTETGKKLTPEESHYGHTLLSTPFTYGGVTCIFVDDTLGNLYIAATRDGFISVLTLAGTVDYQTGRVSIQNVPISAYTGNYIEITVQPYSQHIVSSQNTILQINDNEVMCTTTEVV